MASKLDIIVTHYKEPWQTGEKFFSMLSQQRGIDFNDIRVILVNDGEENKLPEDYFSGRPYRVDQICIEHAGVSAARNAGLAMATAEWVTFCDFDDTFTDIYSLRRVVSVLPAPNFDLLWYDFFIEGRVGGDHSLKIKGNNLIWIHGKLFRRQFLADNDMVFDTDIGYGEDSEFCATQDTIIDHQRIGKINSPWPMYVWCYTEDSITTTPGREVWKQKCTYIRHKKMVEIFKQRMPYNRQCTMVVRTVIHMYHTLNVPALSEELLEMKEDFKKFWKENKKYYYDTTPEDMAWVSKANVEQVGAPNVQIDETIGIDEWLKEFENECKE